MPQDERYLGTPARVFNLRSCGLLRLVQKQARHETFSRHNSSDRAVDRTGRRLALVLRRSSVCLSSICHLCRQSTAVNDSDNLARFVSQCRFDRQLHFDFYRLARPDRSRSSCLWLVAPCLVAESPLTCPSIIIAAAIALAAAKPAAISIASRKLSTNDWSIAC